MEHLKLYPISHFDADTRLFAVLNYRYAQSEDGKVYLTRSAGQRKWRRSPKYYVGGMEELRGGPIEATSTEDAIEKANAAIVKRMTAWTKAHEPAGN